MNVSRLVLDLVICAALGGFAAAQALPAQNSTPPSPPSLALQSTDPALNAHLNLPLPKNPRLPTLWIVGDSTVRNGKGDGGGGQWGWGEPIVQYFDTGKINVVNRAIGGRSSRTYITEGHWQEVVDMMKAGDFLLVQFGHNDSGPLDDPARARASIPGTGDDSKEIENPVMKKHETVHTFGWYMRQYVEGAKAKGVTVFVCSLIPRKTWKDGHVVRNLDSYAGWAHTVADQEHVAFLDLNEIIAREYDLIGEAGVEPLFADPHTHTSRAGAELNAKAVITGLKLLHPDPLEKYFSPAAKGVPGFMPPLGGAVAGDSGAK